MARKISAIQKQMLDYTYANYGTTSNQPFYVVFHDSGNNLITPSQTNKFVLITFIVAVCVSIFEQILDVFRSNMETLIASAPAGSPLWLQAQILKFQYSATTPQIIQLTNYTPVYPVVNAALRPVVKAAVVTDPSGGYLCKVADLSGSPLSAPIINALTSYLNQINFGVPYSIVNSTGDKLMLAADIRYDGQYDPVIKAAVTAALQAFYIDFDSNNFNGDVLISKLEDVIQSVAGVVDVQITQCEATIGATVFVLVNNSQTLIARYNTYAGYVIEDTGGGRDLATTLNFIVN